MALRRQCSLFLLALGFLSRLAPARAASPEDMAAACLYFPCVGAVLGLFQLFLPALGIFGAHVGIQALVAVLLTVWLTRALHLDGLADLCDALGSGAQGDGFRAILKDSRLGAFGAVGLVLVLAAYLLLTAICLREHALAALFAAPVVGRCMPICLVALAPVHPDAGLGAIISRAPRPAGLTVAGIAALTAFPCLGFLPALSAFFLCLCALLFLTRAAKRHGGYNGDFLGCAIIAGEVSVLFAASAV